MSALRYRLFPPEAGHAYFCKACERYDDWRPRLDAAGRFAVGYQCGCGQATIAAHGVAGREPSDPDVAALFAVIDEWFEGWLATLEDLHCPGAWREAHELARWLEGA